MDAGRKNYKKFAMAAWDKMPDAVKEAWESVDPSSIGQKRTASERPADTTKTTKAAHGKKAKKDTKEPDGPKRPLSAYMFFTIKERPNLPSDMLPTVKTSELGKRWKELSDDDKTEFVKAAAEDRARYEREKSLLAGQDATTAGAVVDEMDV